MWILQDIEALYKDSSFEAKPVIQVFLVNMQNGKLHISKLVKKATKKKKKTSQLLSSFLFFAWKCLMFSRLAG